MEELNEEKVLNMTFLTPVQASSFFHKDSHMQTFFSNSFSSFKLYFKTTEQLSVMNIKKMECNVSMLQLFFLLI